MTHNARILGAAIRAWDRTLGSLTVGESDPYRMDTPANHRDAQWVAELIADLDSRQVRRYHTRGLHYAAVGRTRPDGRPYANDKKAWAWIGESVSTARWLGYIAFDKIIDRRHDQPLVRLWEPPRPFPYADDHEVFTVAIPDDLTAVANIGGFDGTQPYHLALWGEKSSLIDVLGPVADRYQADLYLPTGDGSITMVHGMAADAVRDGRELIVTYIADCDPSGWNMPIHVARKLQALKDIEFPGLEFRVYRAGLTPRQVRRFADDGIDLPGSVIKDEDKRKVKWGDATGVQQVEVDALITLYPELLTRIAEDALDPFFDHTLADRVADAKADWLERAQALVDEHIGDEGIARREDALARLEELRIEAEEIIEGACPNIDGEIRWPEAVIPGPEVDEDDQPPALFDSSEDFEDSTDRLIKSQAYDEEDAWG